MKYFVLKGDKKKKKEVVLEIVKLEEELISRYKKEFEVLENDLIVSVFSNLFFM